MSSSFAGLALFAMALGGAEAYRDRARSRQSWNVRQDGAVPDVSRPVTSAANPRIINGVNATIEGVPYIGGLVSFGEFPNCGGSFISPTLFLTAAHCVEHAKDLNQLKVGYGNAVTADVPSRTVDVSALHMHPSYVDVLTGFDIAILELARPADLSAVSMAPIRVSLNAEWPAIGDEVRASGWGSVLEGGDLSPATLQTVELVVRDLASTRAVYGSQRELDAAVFATSQALNGPMGCMVDGSRRNCDECFFDPYNSGFATDCCSGGIWSFDCLNSGAEPGSCISYACPDVVAAGTIAASGAVVKESAELAHPLAGVEPDTCHGNSGGPLVGRRGGQDFLVGVVSSGIGCGFDGVPGLYWGTASSADFIRSIAPHGSLRGDATLVVNIQCLRAKEFPECSCAAHKRLLKLPAAASCGRISVDGNSYDDLRGSTRQSGPEVVGLQIRYEGFAEDVNLLNVCDVVSMDTLCSVTWSEVVADGSVETRSNSNENVARLPLTAGGYTSCSSGDSAPTCPYAMKTFHDHVVDGVSVNCSTTNCTRPGQSERRGGGGFLRQSLTRVRLDVDGCGRNLACCKHVLSEVACDGVPVEECMCNGVRFSCAELYGCSHSSRKSLLGLLGLIGVIPLTLCSSLLLALLCCHIRRRRIGVPKLVASWTVPAVAIDANGMGPPGWARLVASFAPNAVHTGGTSAMHCMPQLPAYV
eukprot:TRINITY_DN884_c0_g1_i1.p1 TRINITY_DN884_c0_g1~~TRINITY_DN884_c0_g1_i1.p1  ORF type:complete len:701 (+),score=46.09 TRINITY_DN884_c0_g1_i1:191-2293(+)